MMDQQEIELKFFVFLWIKFMNTFMNKFIYTHTHTCM